MRYLVALAALGAGLACNPATSRPLFGPVPAVRPVEIELPLADATQRLAELLVADSIPVTRVEIRDGYLETPWFDAATGQPVSRRPLGPGTVRVRGWVDPSQPGHSALTVETVYRPIADPSLPERELDVLVPPDDPAAVRVRRVIDRLVERYGEPAPTEPPAKKN